MENGHLLVNNYVVVGVGVFQYAGATMHYPMGVKLSSPNLPELSQFQTVTSDWIYSPLLNIIFLSPTVLPRGQEPAPRWEWAPFPPIRSFSHPAAKSWSTPTHDPDPYDLTKHVKRSDMPKSIDPTRTVQVCSRRRHNMIPFTRSGESPL